MSVFAFLQDFKIKVAFLLKKYLLGIEKIKLMLYNNMYHYKILEVKS
jgi:hypothetical protein